MVHHNLKELGMIYVLPVPGLIKKLGKEKKKAAETYAAG